MPHENIDDMYREQVMELYKSPSNFGQLKNPSHSHTSYNTVCGDEITVHLLIKDGIIKDVKFSGSGCVVAMVASSLLTDKIKGMKVADVRNMRPEAVLAMLKMKLTPARMKCALLCLEAVKGALK